MREHRSGTAAALAILLIGVALGAGWLMVAPTVFGGSEPVLEGPLPGSELAEPASAGLMEGMQVLGSFQISQPRDPFRPLITEESAAGGGDGGGFQPSGTTVKLVEIRDVDGVLRATVEVNGTSYDVGVGDTFAGSFKVVSLDSNSGVFLFGDNAFELSVGQQILK